MRQNKRFAKWFADARRAVHLTQEQLAERMGVSQPTIGYWETEGRLSMEPEEIRRLAVHLRVDPVVVAEVLGYPVRSQGASAETNRHLPPPVEQFQSIGRRLEELRRDWAELDRQFGSGEGEASPPSRDAERS